MEWVPDAIVATGDVLAVLGYTGLIIFAAVGLLALTIWLKVKRGDRPTIDELSSKLPQITCAWGDQDRASLAELRRDVSEIRRDVDKTRDDVSEIKGSLRH